MKKIIILFVLSILSFTQFYSENCGFSVAAQINWLNFDRVKITVQNGRIGTFPSDSNITDNRFREDDSWCITLGKEVRQGVYIILDENGNNTGNLISFGETGMSGLWGWLILHYTNAESPYKEDHAKGKGFFHTRHYSLMLYPTMY